MAINWRKKTRAFAVNIGVMFASLLVFALICELIIFRFVLLPSDMPHNVWMNGMVRLQPGDTGVWRIGDEIAARFAVNSQGWNSGAGDYRLERTTGVPRVAIVGDSYVEAFQVDITSSFADVLAQSTGWEVYRFGIGAAPLSHHLLIAEREAMAYAPDWLVVMIVHNDFDESFLFRPGRYTSSFLKLELEDGEVVGEIEPTPYRPTWVDTVRRLATIRYLYYRQQLRNVVLNNQTLLRLFFGRGKETVNYEANIDTVSAQRHWRNIEATTNYVFERLAEVVHGQGARLLLVMDGNRNAIYAGEDIENSTASALNRLAARTAAAHDIPFLDLHQAFAADWAAHGIRFEFARDSHWNERGHAIAAREIEAFIRSAEQPPR